MRILTSNELYKGMVLGADFVINGNTVLYKYQILNEENIDLIRSFCQRFNTNFNVWVLDLVELKPLLNRPSFSTYYINYLVNNLQGIFNISIKNPDKLNDCIVQLRDYLNKNRNSLYKILLLNNSHLYTFEHSMNVTLYSMLMGFELDLSDSEMSDLILGAVLHDIGKLKINNSILDKPTRLSPIEFESIKQHPIYGRYITNELDGINNNVRDIITQHHEKCNGKGYPFNLSSSSINPLAKIVTVADIFDAVTSQRSYHKARPSIDGVRVLSEGACKGELDSQVVNCFVRKSLVLPNNSMVVLNTGDLGLVIRNTDEVLLVWLLEKDKVVDLNKSKELKIKQAV